MEREDEVKLVVSKAEPCPFGPELEHYWARLTERERAMQLDAEGLYSLAIQAVALPIAERIPGKIVIDAFCGSGGFSIALARAGKQVIAIDTDAKRLAMAEFNSTLWDLPTPIRFIHGDARSWIPLLPADAILLDPPWGGADYQTRGVFRLEDFQPNGRELLRKATEAAPFVALRIPKTFDMKQLSELQMPYQVEDNLFDGKIYHKMVYFGG